MSQKPKNVELAIQRGREQNICRRIPGRSRIDHKIKIILRNPELEES
jgi:hypothetical protein